MNDIAFGTSIAGVRAATSLVAAGAYHDTHHDIAVPRPGMAAASVGADRPAVDLQASVAEVIAATRAIVLGPGR